MKPVVLALVAWLLCSLHAHAAPSCEFIVVVDRSEEQQQSQRQAGDTADYLADTFKRQYNLNLPSGAPQVSVMMYDLTDPLPVRFHLGAAHKAVGALLRLDPDTQAPLEVIGQIGPFDRYDSKSRVQGDIGELVVEARRRLGIHIPWVGLQIKSVSTLPQEDRDRLALPGDSGFVVAGIVSGSPASRANIKVGDVVSAVDGLPVSMLTLPQVILAHKPGDVLTLTLVRNNDTFKTRLIISDVTEQHY